MKSPLLLAFLAVIPASAADLDFYRDVYPFLKSNCISCHNKTTTKAELNMETPELMIKGGESGPSIVPGNSEKSLIVAASLHKQDMEMPPPNNKSGAVNLSPAEIAILKQWIDQGAKSSVQQERAVVLKAFAASVDPIYTVAVSKDGRLAACGRSNDIFIYDLSTRQLASQITDAHRALVQALAFSPDGSRLASGSFREVKIWKLEPQKNLPAPAKPAPADPAQVKRIADSAKIAPVCSAVSADTKMIVTGCADGSVRVWDAASLKPVAELRASLSATMKSAELDRVIAAQTLEQAFQKSDIARMAAQDKALDELLKKANDAIAAMKKVLPEKQKAVPPATEAKATAQKAVDELKSKIATAPGAKPDAALAQQLKDAQEKFLTVRMTEVSALAAVSAAESNVKDAEDDVKRINDSKSKNAKAIAAANAAASAAKAAQDKAAAELAALKQSLAKPSAKPVAVAVSSDNQRVAAVFDDGTARAWAVATGYPVVELSSKDASALTLGSGADSSAVAAATLERCSSDAARWGLERALGGQATRDLFADRVNAVRFSPDGKTLATGGGELSRSGDVIIFDVASGKATHTWKEKHADTVLCLDFSPDGKLLASGAADKIARVTEVASGKQKNLFEGHTHHVMGIAFRADGRVLATAGADGVVSAWDMIIGERKKKIEGWTKEVTSLQFIGATNQIVTSAGDNRVRVVTDDGSEVRSIANLPDYMQASASTANGGFLIAGGEDSILRVWDGTSGKELAAFGK